MEAGHVFYISSDLEKLTMLDYTYNNRIAFAVNKVTIICPFMVVNMLMFHSQVILLSYFDF